MHPPQRGERKFGLGTTLAGDELDDPQQDAGTQQAGQEAPDPATVTKVEQGQDPATQEATDDTNDDVSWDAHLSIGAHDLGADPASQATDDDPADEAEGRGSACSEQLSTFSKKCSIHTIIFTGCSTVMQRLYE